MKSLIRINNLNTGEDIKHIREIIANYEGILACEINKNKKEVHLVYDALSISVDEIISSIEMSGYMVI